MEFHFSAPFLVLIPPDTNFGEAWESLCFELLAGERGIHTLMRFAPPDGGIDILHRPTGDAFQCKASESGGAGSIKASPSIVSLETAVQNRARAPWNKFIFATNAHYTAGAYADVRAAALRLALNADTDLDFLGPEYWAELCKTHYDRIKHRLNYRVSLEEKQVIDALRSAGYYDQYVTAFQSKIRDAGYRIVVTNNRTPVELEIPFSPEMTVEQCLDAATNLLGISIDRNAFEDLNTSAAPSLSLTIDGRAQGFSRRLSDLGLKSGDNIQLFIQIRWRDERRERKDEPQNEFVRIDRSTGWPDIRDPVILRGDVGAETIARQERILQERIWSSVSALRMSTAAGA